MKKILALACALSLAGCGQIPNACPSHLKSMQEADLYFGSDIAGAAAVSEEDWQRFVDQEIAPRLPNGFTVEDANGAWRGDDGKTVHEASKHLIVVLAGAPDEEARLEAIRTAYKRRFRQQSVLLAEHEICGSF